jgi:hypothetical protein
MRRTWLAVAGLYPPGLNLNFYAQMPNNLFLDNAPMVVVSSNRANWIKKILEHAKAHGKFKGYTDKKTFNDDVVPWYAPARSGRLVYIVVHWSEYAYYENLVGKSQYKGVTVVGYKFAAPPQALDLVGFGASRYAALQFLIGKGYHRAWAVDDNVVNVNHFPITVDAVEQCMTNNVDVWAIGFGAATKNINLMELYDERVVDFNAAADLKFNGAKPVLLQQVVLWNLDKLAGKNLNFCPLFVMSNEDVSISNYLQKEKYDERIITACSIVKFEPESDGNDNQGAAVDIPARRKAMLERFAEVEGSITIRPDNKTYPLSEYVRDVVLKNKDQSTALATQSRAVEQVMAAVAGQGWLPSPDPFNLYNGAPQVQYLLPSQL